MPDLAVTDQIDAAVTLLIVLVLWASGLGLGMSVRTTEVLGSLRRPRLLATTLILEIVLVPLAMWIAVELFVSDAGLATGLLLVAFASAGPLGIKLAAMAGGDRAYAIGLVVVLEVGNIVVVPLWASFLGIAADARIAIDIAVTLVLLVLVPILLGQAISMLRPTLAVAMAPRAARISSLLLLLLLLLIGIRDADLYSTAIASRAGPSSVVVVAFALIAGWVVGGPARPTRVTTSLVTGTRANAAALAIATTTLAHDPQVAAGVVIAGLTSVLMPSVFAGVLAMRERGAQKA